MLRNFGISFLLLGLLAAGVDGFRVREREHAAPASSGSGTDLSNDNGTVHTAEGGMMIPPR
jgi:hypothetical protein